MLFTFEINVDYQHKQAQRLGLAAVTINNLCLTETKQQCNSWQTVASKAQVSLHSFCRMYNSHLNKEPSKNYTVHEEFSAEFILFCQ